VKLLVYGSLTDPDTTGSVLDSYEFHGEATLVDLRRIEGAYPTLAPGGETAGRLLVTDDVAALDAYEGGEAGLYVRVSLPVAGSEETVETYVGDPARLDAPADWPGEGPFAERVRRYVRHRDVVVGI